MEDTKGNDRKDEEKPPPSTNSSSKPSGRLVLLGGLRQLAMPSKSFSLETVNRRREECERKARRGEMDPRLEFTFQILIDATGLPRQEIMDFVFEGNMLDEINQLFLPQAKTKLMWFYQEVEETPSSDTGIAAGDPSKPSTSSRPQQQQPTQSISTARTNQPNQAVAPAPVRKKKLFLTDGWEHPLTGICVYIYRINTTKQIPEEGFQKDLFCGVIDAERIGLVTAVERIVRHVFMEALAFPAADCEDDAANCPSVKTQLLPGLRSFCSALKVCEEVCGAPSAFRTEGAGESEDDVKVTGLGPEDLKKLSSQPEMVEKLEERVHSWIKHLSDALSESERVRRESDSSGPQDELEYWKKRGAAFSQIVGELQSQEIQLTVACLQMARSKVVREWKDTDRRITMCYNEAKDNAKFIQALEKNCHSLYLDDPVKMKDSLLGLLQTVRLIHGVSQFYNTSERTSALMVKITNRMIETCKEYITCRGAETVWSQDRACARDKLSRCVALKDAYRATYRSVRDEDFNFSENYVFGKFDAFCGRLARITATFDVVDELGALLERRAEGLLLGEALEEAQKAFTEAQKLVVGKPYDYLDQRDGRFDVDFGAFVARVDELKGDVGEAVERAFDGVWDTPQGIKFLVKFEKIGEQIPLKNMEEKYDRILRNCEREVGRIVAMYRREKDDPPVPRMFPPIAGRIKWARCLSHHLSELLDDVTGHSILKTLPATVELSKRHKSASALLEAYENDMVAIWMSQHVSDVDGCLRQSLVTVCQERCKFKVNLHRAIPLLIRESDLMSKMDLPLPVVALTLYSKRDQFDLMRDSLQFLLNNFGTVVEEVKVEMRPLFLPQLVGLVGVLAPALGELDWVNPGWKTFLESANDAVTYFKVLVTRAHDIYDNRIIEVLASMQTVCMYSLPEKHNRLDEEIEKGWTIEDFLLKTEEACRGAAVELHRKSLMVEEAVEEILQLVRRAQQDRPSRLEGDESGQPAEDFTFEEELGQLQSQFQNQNGTNEAIGINVDSESVSTQQVQSDWSQVHECFQQPHILLRPAVSRSVQESVRGAMGEMRRYYSRKVVDVLVKVTRASLDALLRRFTRSEETPSSAVFIIDSILLIPKVVIRPNLDEVQEVLVHAGRCVTSVAKGVGQWTGGKPQSPPPAASKWKRVIGHQRTLVDIVSRCTANQQSVVPHHQHHHHHGASSKAGNKEEDARTRRRRFYRLTTEEKPTFPHQHKNFFSNVMENKEVVKTLSLLSSCTQSVKQEISAFLARWRPYAVLWRNEKSQREMTATCTLTDFEAYLMRHEELEARLAEELDDYDIGGYLVVSTEKLKFALRTEIKSCTHRVGAAMKKKYRREMDYVYAVVNEMSRKLDKPIRDLDDVRLVMDTLKRIREQEVDTELKIEPVEEAFNVLQRYEVDVEKETVEQVDNLRYTWTQLLAKALKVNFQLLDMQPNFQDELKSNLAKFRQDKLDYCHEYKVAGPMEPGLAPREASDRLIFFQNRFDGMWRKLQTYQNGEELFGLPQTDYPDMAQIRKELNLLQKLYKLYNDVIDRVSSYYDIPWGEVNIEEINNELMEFQNRCRKLPKGLKEWPAFFALKKTIDDFNDMCPLLELMANKAMKPRHWQRITDSLGHTFELDSEGFCLKNILEAPLLQHKEDIEDICISAMKERDIEAKLRQVTNEWSAHELTFQTFNNRGELLLRGDTTAETIGQLEDSLMILGSLLSNRYNAPFRKQIQQWVHDLSNTNEILERWLLVQNMWVYLEAVFVGGDIAKQLPKEAKRFSKIDKSWQRIMQRARETPGVVACCVGDDALKQLLPHLHEQLELCQRSLSGYLERKRAMFPRFFFVSDPALLEILGQASDSHTIQNHLLSIFDNTKRVKFHDVEYDKMTAVVSSEGEMIQLEKAVRAEGSVEIWLAQLLVTSQTSLHSIIRQANTAINDVNFALLPFLDKMPAQIGLLGLQMIWTRDAELALAQARADKKVMPDTNNRFLELLNTLIDQTTRDLTKIERTKFETLITIHVHQRDIFDILCRLNVRHVNDFEWLKQCRFYFKEEADKTLIIITDVIFSYQNEYLGCTDRLVITPLTDRCYITLAQALAMSMGGAPCGPAGTGKTETVKDMGKTLAKYVVVFNCSDQMDYRGLGRIYKGLAQSGAWGCFDEFNRIELPVLSVAAQQVAVILGAKRDKKKSFIFTDGDVVELCTEFGVFITMNPGYAGRKELPENLKIQFRTVAMMVPDRQIIIRVKLASCGFLENITLARKFYTLYKLCEEQLTKQVHYDFGLRNILSVLRSLGAAKRINQRDAESTIVMRVLRDMNLSKLIDEDEPLFNSLVSDLFPGQSLEKTVYADLEEAISAQVEEASLINHAPWSLKLVQLYETQRVRHGIMTLGPTGAGKTTCIRTLMKSLTRMGQSHREMRMNPKAITAAQMFGRLDVATNDWTDGIFSALWRKTLKLKEGDHVWLVLDGPVDSIWIENLNSVLDDNKTLTLANGDRLPMSPACKIIFEPHNIDNASPATVSRNGMVYMSSSGLDWKPVVRAWLKRRPQNEQHDLKNCFDTSYAILYGWVTQNLCLVMRVLQCNVTLQVLDLLEGLIPRTVQVSADKKDDDEDGIDQLEDDLLAEENAASEQQPSETPLSEDHLRKLYTFAIVWSLGALLETDDRSKFDLHVRENLSTQLDIPPPKTDSGESTTLFDYVVGETGEWETWRSRVTTYAYPELASPDYASILVPVPENVRVDYLLDVVARQGKAVLLVGEQGSAKTAMIKNYMKKLCSKSEGAYVTRSFNFSSATSPQQFQKTVESYVEKRMGSTFGPGGGKRMIVFVDDINLPEINTWGDQITNEIVRQTMDAGGFYNLERPGEFTTIVDVQFAAAMGHPGGGRNDIPSRLKRQFCAFNCPLPSDASIDAIFGAIGRGHYNIKRGFPVEVRTLVDRLVLLTRFVWRTTRAKLLPTPAKFHYAFSLRDLSRIWQGVVGTLSTVIDSEAKLMILWKHECTRVFSDRFTSMEDKRWFDESILDIIAKELGEQYRTMSLPNPAFVDFMRDAPEPTGEEGEDADMELPKVYEPVDDEKELRDRLDMFLSQFNEMVRGSGMDLVFFPDAILHLVKISRVIRHPRGNVMLVGVGGSGKQSLTKLSSFIAGYKSYQIALTRSYNTANFLEDIKILYRTCGCQAKGTTFIFTDLDIKEEGFLEYLNNILSSGVITNLFSKDEQSEIVQELGPIMRRENPKRTINHELVMEYFINRTLQNLHVALCFSPVGEKFRTRAMRFPALVSGCTLDWFQPWPRDALVAVARHFVTSFDIACTPQVKLDLVEALGSIQDVVAEASHDYFRRFRRATHVTPKSYLNFIAGYKGVYAGKKDELSDGALRTDTGLEKLAEARASVEVLKRELADMERELGEATARAERVLGEVTERAREAETVKDQVQAVKEKAETLVASIEDEKALAQQKLEAAKPALEEAEAALNTIKPAHIATVRKLGRPPHLIMRIMDCVLVLFRRRLAVVTADPAAPGPSPKPSWPESLKMMASTTFLLQLQNYPKDMINDEMIDLLQPYFESEDYNMDMAKRVCGDVAGLLSWTKAMGFFHGVNKEVMPLKVNLTMQEARLKIAMDDLAGAERELEERERSLTEVKEQYDRAVLEKKQLTDAANLCMRKMNTATTLINGLGGEKVRWTLQSAEFKEQLGRLVGDVLLATGFLSYCGPYNQEYRANLVTTWMDILETRNIPYTKNLNIVSMLVESSTVSQWNLQGLPNDELSVQNALIVTKARSYPLLIDPQTQGKMWIKNKEASNELRITSLDHKYFRTHLEDCLSLGRPLLIEDVGVELDPVLDNVLEKNFIKSGSIEKVVVGDKECDVLPGFMLYITTKLPNPPYSPEISAKTSIIDFTVTVLGLEDQLLGRVIRMEKADLEAERVALFESVVSNQVRMKELETNLLVRLNSTQGSLVDDEELVSVLEVTKSTSEEVTQKLSVSVATEKKINVAREEFRAVASRGSILYFLIVEMSNVNVMYQNSLKQFLGIFDGSITKSEKSGDTEERIDIILKYLTYEVWAFTQRSLYERHKALFTLMMAMKIDLHRGSITHEEFLCFIKGGASLDLNAVVPKPFRWILDITWLNLVEIQKLETFSKILKKIEQNEKEWRVWYEKEKPEEEEIPCGYQKSLDVFRKLLLVRSWSPDRTLSQSRKYVVDSLGDRYGESPILDLEVTWNESEPQIPLICILSIGSDPSPQINALAKLKEIPIKSVSMGQGQETVARDMIDFSMRQGGWVLLQNVHLSLPFATEVMATVSDRCSSTPSTSEENPPVHESFRIWLTTEVHEQFPIGLLQMSIKFTNEPPQGIRASMRRTYQAVSQDFLDYSSQSQWPPLLYAVAFLHTVVQERRKFGPLGWNVPYEFNQADFAASVQFVQNHLDDMDPKKGVSWPTVCYMLGEVQYGGRVTDDFDKRLLTTFTQVWFCDVLLRPGFEFYKGYKVPQTRNLQGYIDYINCLPATDTPEVFGLHANADITYQINTIKGILDTIVNVQPKEGGGGGGETRESIVYCLAEDMLEKLPPQYNAFEVKESLQRMGALLPMNIFLRQEIDRIQRVIGEVRTTLIDLKLAIDGTIVMSNNLREALDSMYDARIPERWSKVSWDSATLGFWYTELLERDAQFRQWCTLGKPHVFWMTGFFNPQGFLTAMRQDVTRAHKGWALDSVVLQNLITRYNKEDIKEGPSEGVYIHGLFLEGAGLDRKSGKLVESKPKVLYEQMPVVYVYAINTTAGKDPKLYECPIYRKPQRTDQKYVGSIDFETDYNARHWTLRGVALLCDIK